MKFVDLLKSWSHKSPDMHSTCQVTVPLLSCSFLMFVMSRAEQRFSENVTKACLMSSPSEYDFMLQAERLLILYNVFVKSLESLVFEENCLLCVC